MARLKDTEINGNLVVKGDLLNKDGVDLTTAFSNPNLLINSDFRNVINQRGQTNYTGSGNPYTIDRWRSFSSYVEIVDGGIKISNETTQAETYFAQTFEQNISGKYTVTVSVKEKSEHSVAVYCNGTSYNYLHQGVNTFLLEGQNLYNLAFAIVTGGYIVIEYIKLEQGSIATPFVPRNYGEELLICQRYFQVFIKQPIYTVSTNSTSYFGMHYNIPMRTNPTMRLLNVYNSSATEITDVTLSSQISYASNMVYIKLSKTITQYGYITYIFDAEIY